MPRTRKFSRSEPLKVGSAQSEALKHFMFLAGELELPQFGRVKVDLPQAWGLIENIRKVQIVATLSEVSYEAQILIYKDQDGRWQPYQSESFILANDWTITFSFDPEAGEYHLVRTWHHSGHRLLDDPQETRVVKIDPGAWE